MAISIMDKSGKSCSKENLATPNGRQVEFKYVCIWSPQIVKINEEENISRCEILFFFSPWIFFEIVFYLEPKVFLFGTFGVFVDA